MDPAWQWVINNGFAVLATVVLGRVVWVLWRKVEVLEDQKCVYGAKTPRKCQELESMIRDSTKTLHHIKKAVDADDGGSSDGDSSEVLPHDTVEIYAKRKLHAAKK